MCQRSAGLVSICDQCLVENPAVRFNIYMLQQISSKNGKKGSGFKASTGADVLSHLMPLGMCQPLCFSTCFRKMSFGAQKKPSTLHPPSAAAGQSGEASSRCVSPWKPPEHKEDITQLADPTLHLPHCHVLQ